MEIRNMGGSGLRVSLIGLGCNNFGERVELDDARPVVHKALDLGITFFDTADRYGSDGRSEIVLGELLGVRRKDIVLATKFGFDLNKRGVIAGGSRRYVMKAVEDSLRRLRTDWIDLYQMHTPDPDTPIEETLGVLDDLVHAGKIRYFGLSNFAGWQVAEAEWTARIAGLNRCVSVQDEYSLIYRGHEKELIPAVEAYGLGFLPYRPLASGLLTGKYKRNEAPPPGTRFANLQRHADKYASDRNFDVAERVEAFARDGGWAPADLALAWLASKPFVASVIPGASRPEQVEANVNALSRRLTGGELAELDRISA